MTMVYNIISYFTDRLQNDSRVVGMEQGRAAECSMVLEDNAAALRIEGC